MDTTFIDKIQERATSLQERKQFLEAEIANIAAELNRLNTAMAVYAEMGGHAGATTTRSPVTRAAITSLHRTITKREQILSAALELLQSGAKPTEEILDGLAAKGIVVSGDDRKTQLRNISAYLSKAKGDIGIEATRLGWALKSAVNDATELNTSQPRIE